MILAEDQLALGSLGRAPVGDTPLQGAQHTLAEAPGMAAVEFFEQAGRPDVGHGFQKRHEILPPDIGEGIGAGAIGARRLLARQGRTGLDAPPGALAEAGLGCRDSLRVAFPS